MKILTIGPFPPLRGGISDFHYSLFNEFSKHHDVSVLSFKKLYPSILFPGKNQYHDKHVDVDSVYNILDPINIFGLKSILGLIISTSTSESINIICFNLNIDSL